MVKECLQLDRDICTIPDFTDSGTTAGIEPVLIRYGLLVCVYCMCVSLCVQNVLCGLDLLYLHPVCWLLL